MFIFHIALQGCLRARNVQYGITPDTGGHIRYVLELAEAMGARSDVARVEIATRAFSEPGFEPVYAQTRERVTRKCDIVRFTTPRPGYVAKEQLWSETRAYATAVVRYLKRLPEYPDVIHAHYADAGQVAAWIKHELDVPFIFTAHSLGRVKQIAGNACAGEPVRNDVADDALRRRIAAEEAALADANLVIASSNDEAQHQLGLYDNHDAQRTCVIAPGCALDNEAAPPQVRTRRIEAALRPFLRQADKPPVLALARPVQRKNLAGLVRAFGADPRLRELSNLVIFAGNRHDLDTEKRENADVIRELLYLIDRYDLYGHVALPKHHEPGDVGAIYHWAAARRGLFANVAFSEPFGLTLIEAARFGLPVVATNRGGPCDIVGEHRSGVLVEPQNDDAIGQAMRRLLGDAQAWSRHAKAARRTRSHFNWTRHASAYMERLDSLLNTEQSASWRRQITA